MVRGSLIPKATPVRRRSNLIKNGDLCVCYVLSYRAPSYVRTRTLLAALKECDGVRVVVACNNTTGIWRYAETFSRLLRTRRLQRPDVYILGFRGHEIFCLVKAIAGKKPLIVDALMSPYAAVREENKLGLLGRLIAPLIYLGESHILKRADAVLTDTSLQAAHYAESFGIERSKIVSVPVGAIERLPSENALKTSTRTGEFSVLFYGSFLPLHGLDVIINAAGQLTGLPIRFNFIGGGARDERYLRQRCTALGITRYSYRRWVSFDALLSREIPSADLCLGGPFGATPQASRVVTGKTSQFLALGKATVVGKIAEDYGFADRENCLLVEQGDADVLAAAIRWAFDHQDALVRIGQAGRDVYHSQMSVQVISSRMAEALKRIGPRAIE